MNQQWLTTLMSKGIELEQSLRQQFQSAKEGLKAQLEERGIRLSPSDLAAVLEELSPKASHAALSYAMDIMRPFSAGMGLRISRLSDTQVEMIIPARTRNMNELQQLHEGAMVTAAVEAVKLLWGRHSPMGRLEILVTQVDLQVHKSHGEEARVRWELSETLREMVLAQLRTHQQAEAEAEVRVFDENEQAVADLHLNFNFKHTPALGGQQAE